MKENEILRRQQEELMKDGIFDQKFKYKNDQNMFNTKKSELNLLEKNKTAE